MEVEGLLLVMDKGLFFMEADYFTFLYKDCLAEMTPQHCLSAS